MIKQADIPFPELFSPFKLNHMILKNRICISSNNHCLQAWETAPTEAAIRYYASKAKGGAALITAGSAKLDPEIFVGRPQQPYWNAYNIYDEAGLRYFTQQTDAIHAFGARAAVNFLYERNGGYDKSDWEKGRVLYHCNAGTGPDGVPLIEMPEEEMDRVADFFAGAVLNARDAGFDMVTIYQKPYGRAELEFFASPLRNKRADQYGGSPENRARFHLMILDRIRKRVGGSIAINLNIGNGQLAPGWDIEDRIAFLKLLEDRLDTVQVSREGAVNRAHPRMDDLEGEIEGGALARAVKASSLRLPVIFETMMGNPYMAGKALAEGYADLVANVRPTIADPELPNKCRAGRLGDVVPCIECHNCHDDHKKSRFFSCSVNPRIGREHRLPYLYGDQPPQVKKVAVVGGGPAGMKAALTAAERGHRVTLYEKRPELGGNIRFADEYPFKKPLRRYKDYLCRQLETSGVRVLLGVEATPELLEAEGYDAVLAAVGSDPVIPPIPGAEGKNVIPGCEAYDRRGEISGRVVIGGGGLTGCETGIYHAMAGKDVTILEMGPVLAPDDHAQHKMQVDWLMEQNAERLHVLVAASCTRITEAGVFYKKDGEERFVPADTVILATGLRAREAEAEAFRGAAFDFEPIGDCLKAANVKMATRTGFDAAMAL